MSPLLLLLVKVGIATDKKKRKKREKTNRNISSSLQTILRIAQLNAADERSCTALLHACKSGNVEAALALVETSGVDLELRDDQGMTALMWAAMLGFRVIVIALLQVRSSALGSLSLSVELSLCFVYFFCLTNCKCI